jgi:dienelactone hydrolase
MKISSVEYHHAGDLLVGQIAVPDGEGRRPAVLVMHDAVGLGGVVPERIRRLAGMGYVAFASDMYGNGVRFDDPMQAGPSNMDLMGNPEKLRSRVLAAFDVLRARPEVDPTRIAAIGFCFGGMCVLELARSGADAKLVISYHGLLTTKIPAQPGVVKAKVVLFCGDLDIYAPPEDVATFRGEMNAAEADWQATIYGRTLHAFTDPRAAEMTAIPGLGYCPVADRLSWAGTTALLEDVLGSPGQGGDADA